MQVSQSTTAPPGFLPLVIVGAGPAGLAAGISCLTSGIDFRIIDMGNSLEGRSHASLSDLGHGIGGAGLYSDGKFSFYPSATQLWLLEPRHDLEKSYEWMASELHRIGVPLPNIPSDVSTTESTDLIAEQFLEKSYASLYANFEQREILIQKMQGALTGRIWSNTRLYQVEEHERGRRLSLVRPNGVKESLVAGAVLIATGRFGPLLIHRSPSIPKTFRRLEVGVRIEQPSEKFFLSSHPQIDPKYILLKEGEGVEYRTFCCCRNGEIVVIEHEGIRSLSGRSDVTPTGRSNVGFHARILDSAKAAALWPMLAARLHSFSVPSKMTMAKLLSSANLEETPIGHQLGPEVTRLIVAGLRRLVEHLGESSFSDALVHAPALEGLFEYPIVDRGLRVPGNRVWVAGDANGQFRGLVAALVSGYFAGLQIARELPGMT